MRFYSLLFLVFILSISIDLRGQSNLFGLTVLIENLATNDGFVMLLVTDEEEKDVAKLVVPIFNQSAKATVYLEKGKYGLAGYHDVNINEKLDVNMFGIPSEPYGFSNDARSTFSKPDYEETLVVLNANKKISFQLK